MAFSGHSVTALFAPPTQRTPIQTVRKTFVALAAAAVSQLALAAPVNSAGALTASDATYNRVISGNPPTVLSGVGTAVSYDVYSFMVSLTDTYSVGTLSAAFTTGTADGTFITI